MSKERKSKPKIWIQIPENLSSMSDEEIESFSRTVWQEITQRLRDDHES